MFFIIEARKAGECKGNFGPFGAYGDAVDALKNVLRSGAYVHARILRVNADLEEYFEKEKM